MCISWIFFRKFTASDNKENLSDTPLAKPSFTNSQPDRGSRPDYSPADDSSSDDEEIRYRDEEEEEDEDSPCKLIFRRFKNMQIPELAAPTSHTHTDQDLNLAFFFKQILANLDYVDVLL